MAFSLGIWSHGTVPGGTIYRWEADEGRGASGFVVFNAESGTIRPSDREGNALGDFVVDAAAGRTSGNATGVDGSLLVKVAIGIVKAYHRAGGVPATAHTYYG
jgi:hypothetical protein